ncbi:Sodium/hydrogen exchanger family-domain-containing protein [Lineolata rhizophorae]|uniref:Sodium/hydrogen exchanger n=1 Tax=Lineolata rhizophorae TaxID=578093 RepID=A0A6A6P0B5_9PEZI|nr:Sodium/hydrogen exchanger family-domain-containing protein [Lineolata rhizophorae]
MASALWAVADIIKREAEDADGEDTDAGQKEIFASWSLFILIILLIIALFTSYLLQTRRVQAVHETVLSIFAGMVVGLILRLVAVSTVLEAVSFDYQFFFNLLLPPIILASGFELHQGNFFRNIGTILTFAFAGTFISAVVLGVILYLWTRLPLDGVDITFVDAASVGATLSATDPVTILAIFTTYKVDPKLYTVIFGESILNDAIAIVLFETAQKYKEGEVGGSLTVFSLFESIGIFLLVFFGSLMIGLIVGIATSLLLKFTYVRRFPKTESCIIILIAYASYFFSNAIHMSGIVSLLFCGICMKHYAYHNMSRRTQLTTKFIFQVMAQLSENFIFIYLGLSLFTDTALEYKPLFILITVLGICVARYCAVFPLARAVNFVLRYRARRRGREPAEEMPYSHQVMLFWAGLRGAVGVALAAGLTGPSSYVLRATVLVVVVLTVIIFGGTTARMLEILGIRTGVVEEIDSDDEFDIEVVAGGGGGFFSRKQGQGFGHTPRPSSNGFALSSVSAGGPNANKRPSFSAGGAGSTSYSSGNVNGGTSPTGIRPALSTRRPSSRARAAARDGADQGLLSSGSSADDDFDDAGDLDLPPASSAAVAGRTPSPFLSAAGTPEPTAAAAAGTVAHAGEGSSAHHGAVARMTAAAGAMGQLISGLSEDPAQAFRKIDEGFIKPTLLLDASKGGGGGGAGGGGGGSGNGGGGGGGGHHGSGSGAV